ncbi:MAG: hypothetical protein R2838_05885 [Caldilineaceae bacterium]
MDHRKRALASSAGDAGSPGGLCCAHATLDPRGHADDTDRHADAGCPGHALPPVRINEFMANPAAVDDDAGGGSNSSARPARQPQRLEPGRSGRRPARHQPTSGWSRAA